MTCIRDTVRYADLRNTAPRSAAGERRLSTVLACLLAVVALAALTACGGGGGGGGSPSEPPPPPPVSFTGSSSGASSISLMQGGGTTNETLVLELRANQVSALYGLAFDLDYPTQQLTFLDASAGAFLAPGGTQPLFEYAEPSAGEVVVGISRIGQVGGVDGTGVVMTLRFAVGANGSGPLSFSRNEALAPDGTPLNLSWGGGTVSINR